MISWRPGGSTAGSVKEAGIAVENWEAHLREHVAVGGAMSDEDKKMTLLKTLPREISEDLVMKLSSFGSYHDLREQAENRCELVTIVKTSNRSIHHVD